VEITVEAKELIERYVHEVGQQLPANVRSDITLELRSLLHDSLDEMATDMGQEPTVKMAAAMLQEFGKPEKIAARYRPERYLIGPELYPLYRQVLVIVFLVTSALPIAGLVLTLLNSEITIFGVDGWNWLGNYVRNVLVSAGIVTIIFAIVEYTQDTSWKQPEEAEWDPMSLPAVKDGEHVNRLEMAFGMMWNVAFIILFNFYRHWVVAIVPAGGETQRITLLAPEFVAFVPWLTLVWGLELALKSVVLLRGRWTRLTRWLELALMPLNIYVVNLMRQADELLTIPGLTELVQVGLAFVIVILVLDGLYKLYRLLAAHPLKPQEIFKSRLV
jgi:hypothetical protein